MIVIAVSFFVYRFVSSYISDTYKVLHLFSRVILRIFGLLQNKYNWCDKNIFFEIIFLVSKIIHFFKYYTINSFYYFLYCHILYFFFFCFFARIWITKSEISCSEISVRDPSLYEFRLDPRIIRKRIHFFCDEDI